MGRKSVTKSMRISRNPIDLRFSNDTQSEDSSNLTKYWKLKTAKCELGENLEIQKND